MASELESVKLLTNHEAAMLARVSCPVSERCKTNGGLCAHVFNVKKKGVRRKMEKISIDEVPDVWRKRVRPSSFL